MIVVFCTNCGNPLPENAKFCPNCGVKLEPAAPLTAPVYEEIAPTETPKPVEEVAEAAEEIAPTGMPKPVEEATEAAEEIAPTGTPKPVEEATEAAEEIAPTETPKPVEETVPVYEEVAPAAASEPAEEPAPESAAEAAEPIAVPAAEESKPEPAMAPVTEEPVKVAAKTEPTKTLHFTATVAIAAAAVAFLCGAISLLGLLLQLPAGVVIAFAVLALMTTPILFGFGVAAFVVGLRQKHTAAWVIGLVAALFAVLQIMLSIVYLVGGVFYAAM